MFNELVWFSDVRSEVQYFNHGANTAMSLRMKVKAQISKHVIKISFSQFWQKACLFWIWIQLSWWWLLKCMMCVCVCGALILIYYSKDTCTKTVPINLNMYFFLKLFLNIFYIKRCSYKYKASLWSFSFLLFLSFILFSLCATDVGGHYTDNDTQLNCVMTELEPIHYRREARDLGQDAREGVMIRVNKNAI